MNEEKFTGMVSRLERESAEQPRMYLIKVASLALLGLALLLLISGAAGLGLLLLAGAAVAMLFSGAHAWILLFKLGKLLFLLAVPLWMLVKTSMQTLFVRLPPPQGEVLDRARAPALFAAIDQMRERMKGPRFHQVLITDEVNAAVVQRPLFGLLGWPRNYLLLGLPLLERMRPEEALAVVAHEYGHLAGSHGRFAASIYRLRLNWSTIQQLADQWQGWLGALLRRVVGWYAPYFNAYTFVLARANEYQADRASAELMGATTAAHALQRVNLAAPHYDAFLDRQLGHIREQETPPADLAHQWAHEPAAESALEQRWLDEALTREPHAYSTHPSLADRLRALGPVDAGRPAPLEAADSAARAWLDEATLLALRTSASEAWRARVSEPWAERHRDFEAQRRELADLEAVEAPEPGQQLRLIQLRQTQQPGFDAVAAYEAHNAAYADVPAALWGEGAARLDADDASGLELLDRAMALEPPATAIICGRALQFLAGRGEPERAAAYRERWQTWHERTELAQAQLEHLDVRHELQAPEFGKQGREAVLALLDRQGKHVAEAFYARRLLPANPEVVTHVLGVKLGWLARRRGLQSQVVKALAGEEWPGHVMIVSLDGTYKPLLGKLRAIPQARLR